MLIHVLRLSFNGRELFLSYRYLSATLPQQSDLTFVVPEDGDCLLGCLNDGTARIHTPVCIYHSSFVLWGTVSVELKRI